MGISKGEQRDIFLLLHRSINDEIQAKGGTGLGLAIIREIARGQMGTAEKLRLKANLAKAQSFGCSCLFWKNTKEELELNEDGTYFGYRGRAKRSYRPAR